jgi:hypothetical protein
MLSQKTADPADRFVLGFNFRRVSNPDERLLNSLQPSVCTPEPLNGFSLNLVSEDFRKKSPVISFFIRIGKCNEHFNLNMYVYICFAVVRSKRIWNKHRRIKCIN